jgi:hypothetical protein
MPKRNFGTLEEFKAHIHTEGATLVEFSGTKVPCILMSPKKYEQLLHNVYDRKVRADTLLDDVQVKLLETEFEQNFLLYANDMVEFFEALAESGLISLAPDSQNQPGSQNFFMIQLPKRDAAERALEIIKSNLKEHS